MEKKIPQLSENQILPVIEQSIHEQMKKSSIIPLALFNGVLKSFITNPAFMRIHIGEKGFNRGYGVKRVIHATIPRMSVARQIYKLASAANDINLESLQYKTKDLFDIYLDIIQISKDIIENKMQPQEAVNYSSLKRLRVKFWITAGISDFSLAVDKKQTQVYVMAYLEKSVPQKVTSSLQDTGNSQLSDSLVAKELVLSQQPNKLAIKSTNYFTNCFVATKVKRKGGYIGIHCNKEGEMLEGSMANVAFVMKDTKEFILPPFDVTLPGTTSKRCLTLIEKVLIPKGLVSVIRRESLHHKIVKSSAAQVLLLGGDACVPVLELDGIKISSERGPVAKKLQELLLKDKTNATQ